MKTYDCIIVGGGPAGLTAAIYMARANKSTLVLEKEMCGGRITSSPAVYNIPGFMEISGADFGMKMEAQAIEAGAEVEYENVIRVDYDETVQMYQITTQSGIDCASKALIYAAGARNRTLGLAGEYELIGNGISFCSVCDGALYKDKVVAVVGGGNSALTMAHDLLKYAREVYVVQNLPELTAAPDVCSFVQDYDNIHILCNSVVREYMTDDGHLMGIVIQTGEMLQTLDVDGIFLAIGAVPQTEVVAHLVTTDHGYIDWCHQGMFACGDCVANTKQQVVCACGSGATAALNCINYLDSLLCIN